MIEVMGLAVLPARLKKEMAELEEAILCGADLRQNEVLAAHATGGGIFDQTQRGKCRKYP